MSVVINTNSAATMAADNLAQSSLSLQKSLNRLSSGSRIVSPEDDAGGLAVSMKLTATAHRQAAVASNIGNATSFLQTQDGVMSVLGKVLSRMSELRTLYDDPTKNSTDKANYNVEFTQLQTQITSLSQEKFNGISLFGSSGLNVGVTADSNAGTIMAIGGVDLIPTATPSWNSIGMGTSDWVMTSGGTNNGSAMTVGTSATATTAQSNITGPFTLAFDAVAPSGTGNLGIYGPNGGYAAPLIPDSSSHHYVLTDDGTTLTISRDGTTQSSQASIGTAAGSISIVANSAPDITISNLTLTNSGASTSGNLASVTGAGSLGALGLSTITSALQDVAGYRADNGASQSRLGFAADVLTTNKANIEAANSRIVDVDVAAESTQLARYNVLTQAGTAMLSQANQSTQVALKLIG